jgi:hypothetical protein
MTIFAVPVVNVEPVISAAFVGVDYIGITDAAVAGHPTLIKLLYVCDYGHLGAQPT